MTFGSKVSFFFFLYKLNCKSHAIKKLFFFLLSCAKYNAFTIVTHKHIDIDFILTSDTSCQKICWYYVSKRKVFERFIRFKNFKSWIVMRKKSIRPFFFFRTVILIFYDQLAIGVLRFLLNFIE